MIRRAILAILAVLLLLTALISIRNRSSLPKLTRSDLEHLSSFVDFRFPRSVRNVWVVYEEFQDGAALYLMLTYDKTEQFLPYAGASWAPSEDGTPRFGAPPGGAIPGWPADIARCDVVCFEQFGDGGYRSVVTRTDGDAEGRLCIVYLAGTERFPASIRTILGRGRRTYHRFEFAGLSKGLPVQSDPSERAPKSP